MSATGVRALRVPAHDASDVTSLEPLSIFLVNMFSCTKMTIYGISLCPGD